MPALGSGLFDLSHAWRRSGDRQNMGKCPTGNRQPVFRLSSHWGCRLDGDSPVTCGQFGAGADLNSDRQG